MISVTSILKNPCPNDDGCQYDRSKEDKETYCFGNYLLCARFTLCNQKLPVSKTLHPSGIENQLNNGDEADNSLTENATVESQYRNNLKQGTKVAITLKKDQRNGKLTVGIIDRLLTSKPKHTRGIKVRLKDGSVGRVQKILEN